MVRASAKQSTSETRRHSAFNRLASCQSEMDSSRFCRRSSSLDGTFLKSQMRLVHPFYSRPSVSSWRDCPQRRRRLRRRGGHDGQYPGAFAPPPAAEALAGDGAVDGELVPAAAGVPLPSFTSTSQVSSRRPVRSALSALSLALQMRLATRGRSVSGAAATQPWLRSSRRARRRASSASASSARWRSASARWHSASASVGTRVPSG
jgi:hypothetical protein